VKTASDDITNNRAINPTEAEILLTDKVPSDLPEAPCATPAGKKQNSERGEGVISTAVAVLIVAFLGIALWTGFNSMMSTATSRTRTQVEQIGR